MTCHVVLAPRAQTIRFYRVRGIFARRYREDVRANWNQVSIVLWLLYLILFTHWAGCLWAWLGTRGTRTPYPDSWLEVYARERRVIVSAQRLT